MARTRIKEAIMRIGFWAAAVLGAAMLGGLASGAELYVSPVGTANGPGTKEAP